MMKFELQTEASPIVDSMWKLYEKSPSPSWEPRHPLFFLIIKDPGPSFFFRLRRLPLSCRAPAVGRNPHNFFFCFTCFCYSLRFSSALLACSGITSASSQIWRVQAATTAGVHMTPLLRVCRILIKSVPEPPPLNSALFNTGCVCLIIGGVCPTIVSCNLVCR